MASQVGELVELIAKVDLQENIKYKGWELILGVTATDVGIQSLLFPDFIETVLVSIRNPEKTNPCLPLVYKCVINIAATKEGAQMLSTQNDLIVSLLDSLSSSFKYNESVCHILNNLSSHWNNDKVGEIFSNQRIDNLVKLFLSNDLKVKENCKFLALLFANITMHVAGRRVFLECSNRVSDLFLVCGNSEESVIRRLGVSITIRNCCFETDFHSKLLEELNVLPNILLPLMGPEEYIEEEMEKLPIDCQYLDQDKTREKDPKIRRTLVQALCLLCYTKNGWNYLKDHGVYYISRELHTWESDESVKDACETLLVYLLVENYAPPENETMLHITPSETDIIKDIPDFLV